MINFVINLPQKNVDVALEEGEMLVGKTNIIRWEVVTWYVFILELWII